MEKLVESSVSAYMPKLDSIAQERRTELTEIKSKVRRSPEEVEAWFDKEIEKLGNINVSDILSKMR